MDSSDAQRIVLTRAIEETLPDAVSPEMQIEALHAAGAVRDEAGWIARRARFLTAEPLAVYRPLLAMTTALPSAGGLVLAVGVVTGLLFNYLGPSQQIHALYNPICALIAWNVGVYLVLFGRAALNRTGSGPRRRERSPDSVSEAEASIAVAPHESSRLLRPGALGRWILRRSVPALWLRLNKAAIDARAGVEDLGRVARAFWSLWIPVAGPLFALHARRLLNLGATGVAVGATAGMFVRGLFLDYHVVWRSTFLRDPSTVADLLRVVLAPTAYLLRMSPPDTSTVSAMMTPEGVGAESWIWLYAASAGLVILVPRALIAGWVALRMRSVGSTLDLRLGDPYYRELVAFAREQQIDRIAAAIQSDIRVETRRFAAAIAHFVCESLYDGRIVPRLKAFRTRGGRLGELERAITADCEAFTDELEQYVGRAQRDFDESLARAVATTVGGTVDFAARATAGLPGRVDEASRGSARDVSHSLGDGLTRTIGSTVSTAVALVAGAMSGGFGKSLGIAIVATLLGTSGPIGFLIGAIGALVLASGAFVLGHRRATDALQGISLPGLVLRTTLWPARFERILRDGREQCRASVRETIESKLEPLTPEISEQIWRSVRPLLSQRREASES